MMMGLGSGQVLKVVDVKVVGAEFELVMLRG